MLLTSNRIFLTFHPVQGTKADMAMNSSVGIECSSMLYKSEYLILSTEFDFRVLGDGRSASARYANNSNYRNDSLIRKESTLTKLPS